MDAMEFARQWGGGLKPLDFPPLRPMLPTETVSFLHYAGLPSAFRMRHAEQIDFDLLPRALNMKEAWAAEMKDISMPVTWAQFSRSQSCRRRRLLLVAHRPMRR